MSASRVMASTAGSMSSCTSATLGMPAHSSSIASRIVRVLHEPHPPKPAMTTSVSVSSRSQSPGTGQRPPRRHAMRYLAAIADAGGVEGDEHGTYLPGWSALAGLRCPGWHRKRHGPADMRRHDGGDLVAWTPGGHEQDPFRPAEPEARPVGLPGERADLAPQRPPDVCFGPPRGGEETLVLLAEHDRQVRNAPHLVLPQRAV